MSTNVSLQCRRQEMDFTKRRVWINVEACRWNLGKAARPDSSIPGFRRTCINSSFCFWDPEGLGEASVLDIRRRAGTHSGRVVAPGPWADSLPVGRVGGLWRLGSHLRPQDKGKGQRRKWLQIRCLSTERAIQSHAPITPQHPRAYMPLFLLWAQATVPTDLHVCIFHLPCRPLACSGVWTIFHTNPPLLQPLRDNILNCCKSNGSG